MVAGHLQEKKGLFYVVLSYKDEFGKRKTKWVSTGLTVRGNKKKAEAMMLEVRKQFEPTSVLSADDVLYADFLINWLEIIRGQVERITYSSYYSAINARIAPYFRERGVTLVGITTHDIQSFYQYAMSTFGVSATTIIHYHSNIHKSLEYAVKCDRIPYNPAKRVELPRKQKFIGSFYGADELNSLFEAAKGSKLEFGILMAACYGLRRSEVVGLKWSAIDFKNKTFTIEHTVSSAMVDGKTELMIKDRTKTQSSRRTLPLMAQFEERLLTMKQRQQEYKRVCGKSYCTDYEGYIYVDEMGHLITPQYITSYFPPFLKKHDLRRIRFHDLRHSCASLLLANGVNLKAIQEWLGHSNFSTTANIYAHLDFQSKVSSANVVENSLDLSTVRL